VDPHPGSDIQDMMLFTSLDPLLLRLAHEPINSKEEAILVCFFSFHLGSGMKKGSDLRSGSGINILDPQRWAFS
jgi:hypothetical protein